MKAKEYELLARCVEDGVSRGLMQAHKHNERPSHEEIADKVTMCVMSEINEWFDFDGVME
jgi:hypothetical protein